MVEGTERMECGGGGGRKWGPWLVACGYSACILFLPQSTIFSNSYNCSLLCLHLNVQLLNHWKYFKSYFGIM